VQIRPWLALWAGFGLFSIFAGVTVSLHADRLAHRRRVAAMADFFEHVVNLPLSYPAEAHTGRPLKVMIEGSNAMFDVWLSFFREHCAGFVALFVLLPMTLFVNKATVDAANERHGRLTWGAAQAGVAAGVMNVAVMAALAVVIFAEKLWRFGKPFGKAVGVVLIAAGVLAIWFPWLLPGLHAAAMPAM